MVGYIVYVAILCMLAIGIKYRFTLRNSTKKFLVVSILGLIFFGLYLYYSSINAIDSVGYIKAFKNSTEILYSNKGDILSYGLMDIVHKLTNNYSLFRCIVGIIYFIPIVMFIKYGKKNKMDISYFLLLTMLYPYFISMVTLRNTMAASMVLIACFYYFNSNKKGKNLLITSILLGISVGFHGVSIIYFLLFWVYVFFCKIKNKKFLISLFLFADIIVIAILKSGWLTQWILRNIKNETVQYYIIGMRSLGYGFLISVFIQLLYTFFLYLQYKRNINNIMCKDILYLNYVLLLIFPLYAIHIVFFRLYRNILILDFMCYACGKRTKNSQIEHFAIIVLQFIVSFYDSGRVIMDSILR